MPGREEGQETQEISDLFAGSGDLERDGPCVGGGGVAPGIKEDVGMRHPAQRPCMLRDLKYKWTMGRASLRTEPGP